MITESELAISLSNFVSSLRNFVTYLPAEAGLLHKVTQRILKVSQRKKEIIEIKTVEIFDDVPIAQVQSYLRLGKYKLGLLFNIQISNSLINQHRIINNFIIETINNL